MCFAQTVQMNEYPDGHVGTAVVVTVVVLTHVGPFPVYPTGHLYVNVRFAATVLAHPSRLLENPTGHDVVVVAVASTLTVVVLTHNVPLRT